MSFHLVVVKAFAAYKRGDLITDTATIEKLLASPYTNCIVRVAVKGS